SNHIENRRSLIVVSIKLGLKSNLLKSRINGIPRPAVLIQPVHTALTNLHCEQMQMRLHAPHAVAFVKLKVAHGCSASGQIPHQDNKNCPDPKVGNAPMPDIDSGKQ